ncbi:MAG: cation:proton antiporter [Planctomycetota bacterium]
MNSILCLGIILVGAIVAEKTVNYFRIPAITSYILLGILIGPHALNITGNGLILSTELLSNIVLGLIAFHIGRNFSLENFKKIGKAVLSISLSVTLSTLFCVTAGLYIFANQSFYMALIFGAISTATAPATTMIIIRQYRARGTFTDILIGTVAIDDAWGIMIFSLCLSVAQTFQYGNASELFVLFALGKAIAMIILSVILGLTMAYIVSWVSAKLKRPEVMLTFILGAIFINTGISIFFNASPLLSNMFFGAVLVNIDKTAFRYFESVSKVDWPLYVMFYVFAGAGLEIGLLSSLGLVGSIYIASRIMGRVGGGYVGGLLSGTDSKVRIYMGIALMPQAGVAIGLAMLAKTILHDSGATIFNTIIITTVIYEILGPIATRYALSKAGDI